MNKSYLTISLILVTLISVIRSAEAAERASVSSIRPDSYCTTSASYPGESRRSCVYINTSALRNRDTGIQHLAMPLMEGVTVVADRDRFLSLPSRSYSALWQGHSPEGSLKRLHLTGTRPTVVHAEFWHQGQRYRIEPAGKYHRVVEFGGFIEDSISLTNDSGLYVSTAAGLDHLEMASKLLDSHHLNPEQRDAISIDPRGGYAIGTGENGVTHYVFTGEGNLSPKASFAANAVNRKGQIAMLDTGDYAAVNHGNGIALYGHDAAKSRLNQLRVLDYANRGTGQLITASPNSRDIYVVTNAPAAILRYQMHNGDLRYQGGVTRAGLERVTAISISSDGEFLYAAESSGRIHAFSIDAYNGDLIEVTGSPFSYPTLHIVDAETGVDGWGLLVMDANSNRVISLGSDPHSGALQATYREGVALRHAGTTMRIDRQNRIVHIGTQQGWLESFSVRPDASLRWQAVLKMAGPVNQIGLINY